MATVGLGASDFGHRIFALLVVVVSCMNSRHGSGASNRSTGMAMAGDSVP